MKNSKEKKSDENLQNTETICVSVLMTEEELGMLDLHCQQAGITRQQGLRDGIKTLNAK